MSSSIPLILHPGFGKCGSTSIQHFIYSNESLLKEHGVFIPDSKFQFSFENRYSPAQSAIPLWYFYDFLENRKPIELLEDRLDRIIESAKDYDVETLLISSEILAVIESPGTVKVHETLASRFPDTKVVLYIRKQDDWILSSWQQWGHKEGHSFKEWCDYCMDTGRPNFLKTAKMLEKIYGSDTLTVIPLNRSALKGNNLLEDFCCHSKLTQLDLQRSKEGAVANTSLNPYLCEILSLSSSIYPSRDDEFIKELLLDYGRDSTLLLRRQPDFVSPAQRSEIMKFYQKENRLLHSRYFSELDFYSVFPCPEQINRSYDSEPGNSRNHEILGIQIELIVSLMKRIKQLESNQRNSTFNSFKGRVKKIISDFHVI